MRLSLFTVFHGNLAFSSIPSRDLGRVLERCLWPLLEATRLPGVRLGLEMPADSLALLADEDALLFAELRTAMAEGRIELVGSGLIQAILPLLPTNVGLRNLVRGQDLYRELLGTPPRVGYLHEQTYAAGLLPLYRQAGFEALVAEWENPASVQGWPEVLRYRPALVEGTGGARLPCLWNSSVVFQKVQRYAHGELELEELMAYLEGHLSADDGRALCLYGNDVEVFDYRPGEGGVAYGTGPSGEWERLRFLLRTLVADGRFALVTPSEVLRRHPPSEDVLHLESAVAPVSTKKQAKYNVTRWAVCGRDNLRQNARCHALERQLELIGALERASGGKTPVPESFLALAADEIARLWGSDLRTFTTEDRARAAQARAGALSCSLAAHLAPLERDLLDRQLAPTEFLLFNPATSSWLGWPIAVEVRLPPGAVAGAPTFSAGGRPLVGQIEEAECYRDGSLKRALVVLAPRLPPLGTLRVRLSGNTRMHATGGRAEPRIDTPSVAVTLAPRRGATIRTLAFPGIAPSPLAGTVPQGTFAPIELAADWYTGGFVLLDQEGNQHTDLEPTTLIAPEAPEACPIRIPLVAHLGGAYGDLWKTIYVYRDTARVDLRYHLVLRDQRPRSLRLGVLTLDPATFDPAALRVTMVNGGRDVETLSLGGARVAQHEAVSPQVSARGCLGATEGWVDVGDTTRGVTVAYDPAHLAAAPLLQHEPAGDRALTRIFLSLAESDATAAPFFRGHTTFSVSYLGRGAELDHAWHHARAVARGLHVIRPEAGSV